MLALLLLLFHHHHTSVASTPPIAIETMLRWLISHGAFLHPNVSYRDGGMYATAFIAAQTTVASLPRSLEFQFTNATQPLLANIEMFAHARGDPSHFHQPYFQALPTTCQNFACQHPDSNEFTVRGARQLEEDMRMYASSSYPIEASTVMSRRWDSGMRPLLDLFNCEVDSNSDMYIEQDSRDPVANTTYHLRTHNDIEQGKEITWNYSPTQSGSKFDMYKTYGFMTHHLPFSCKDMRLLRRGGDDAKRVACIATSALLTKQTTTTEQQQQQQQQEWEVNAGLPAVVPVVCDPPVFFNATLSLMAEEMMLATMLAPMDVVMLKGASLWIINNINFETDNLTLTLVNVTIQSMVLEIFSLIPKFNSNSHTLNLPRIKEAAEWINGQVTSSAFSESNMVKEIERYWMSWKKQHHCIHDFKSGGGEGKFRGSKF